MKQYLRLVCVQKRAKCLFVPKRLSKIVFDVNQSVLEFPWITDGSLLRIRLKCVFSSA